MKYYVAKIGGSQYIIYPGKSLIVDKQPAGIIKSSVLMFRDNEKIEIGRPYLKKDLNFKVLNELVKGDKIYPTKYKSKSRYRRKIGFRPQYTEIVLE